MLDDVPVAVVVVLRTAAVFDDEVLFTAAVSVVDELLFAAVVPDLVATLCEEEAWEVEDVLFDDELPADAVLFADELLFEEELLLDDFPDDEPDDVVRPFDVLQLKLECDRDTMIIPP